MTQFTANDAHPGARFYFANPNRWTPTGSPGPGDDAVLPTIASTRYGPYTALVTGALTVGTIEIGAGAILDVQAGTSLTLVNGGANDATLGFPNFGGITVAGDLSIGGTFVNSGDISVTGDLTLSGTFDNTGQIRGGGVGAALTIGALGATLTGGGFIVMSGAIVGAAASATLTNVDNSIQDATFGRFNLVNQTSGILFNCEFGPGDTIVNAGSIEFENNVYFTPPPDDIVGATVDNSASGVVLANNGTAHLYGATIAGGSLQTSGYGLIEVEAAWINSDLDGRSSAISNQGALNIANGATLDLLGTIANTGTIESTGGASSVAAPSTATIVGAGALIVNSGVIEADNPNSLPQDRSLVLQDATIADTPGKGVIEANGLFTQLDLESVTITSGDLRTMLGGVIETIDRGSRLNGTAHTVFNQGALVVEDNTALTLQGAIGNSGDIAVVSTGDVTELIVGIGTQLSGGGSVSLSDNAGNAIIPGASGAKGAPASLTNVNNTIAGAGTISADLINGAAGIVDASGTVPLTLNSGTTAITNNGLLEVTGIGSLTIASTVTGTGSAKITAGTLSAEGAFSQNVTFTAGAGELELGDSQGYGGTVSGFATSGGTSFDLRDISFVSSKEATFVGTAAGGTLTVTDGTHTASIHLSGNYLSSTFTASSDGHGGTIVVDPRSPVVQHAAASLHLFVSAAANFGATDSGSATPASAPWRSTRTALATPRP